MNKRKYTPITRRMRPDKPDSIISLRRQNSIGLRSLKNYGRLLRSLRNKY